MEYPKLKRWILDRLNEGFSPERIKDQLISYNYDRNLVEKMVNECLAIRKAEGFGSQEKNRKIKLPLIGLSVFICVALVAVLLFIYLPRSKIDTAYLERENLLLVIGNNETITLSLSGKGEATISVNGVYELVQAPQKIQLSSSIKDIPILIQIPENFNSKKYSGSIVVEAGRNHKELPISIDVVSCMNGEEKKCEDEHGCLGTQTCYNYSWDSCKPSQNWCDEDCNGINETCKSESCKICPKGYIYFAYNYECLSCRYLAYNLIEDVIGDGTPYYGVELRLWTDDNSSFVEQYVKKLYEDYPSYHWSEIKNEWIIEGINSSQFPNPFASWKSSKIDILNSTSDYICVCSAHYSCYCDQLIGRQPENNGCIDTNPGCQHETEQCGTGFCQEEMQLDVEDALSILIRT
jgi:hypothetical protein